MTEKEESDALNEAMAEALESVERRERETSRTGDRNPAHEDVEFDFGDDEEHEDSAQDAVDNPEHAPQQSEQKELNDQLIRMAADFDNFRKRSRREVEEAKKYGVENFVRNLLPVLDNFERALMASKEDPHPVVNGIRMVHKQFVDALSQLGVTAFESVGQIFDPELHEALSQQLTEDAAPGEILDEHERGYMIHDRLLRAARVVVAMPPPAEDASADPSPREEEK